MRLKNNEIVRVRYGKAHHVLVNKTIITNITIEVKFTYRKVSAKLHFRPVKQGVGGGGVSQA